MDLLDTLLSYFKNKETLPQSPKEICPNCWGKQEYQGKFFKALKNEKVDIDNYGKKMGWIKKYAEENLNTIKLIRKEETLEKYCPKCKVSYKESIS